MVECSDVRESCSIVHNVTQAPHPRAPQRLALRTGQLSERWRSLTSPLDDAEGSALVRGLSSARPGADQMRHYRCSLAKLKGPQLVFEGPISHSDAFMLSQMFHPALGYEHLDVASRIGRIREVLPEQRAIAPADMPPALESLCEGRAPRPGRCDIQR